ncbi:hypothetical protein RJ640_003381 [Escallonia rubra]|uniref:Uncharacterized protein n=1 Tax=Escallonia rubra TaxID=112253 RepID=A0AA88QQ43_9ASTE|nr:hypothetical protein RJ640_003381 [Escallonia rubra]
MGRSPCCEKAHTNKGAWTKEEDQRLISYIRLHGEGCWRSLPKSAGNPLSLSLSLFPFRGLLRCGKSCRLRWINYLRPDLKRGNFTDEEDELIIKLHSLLGNKWSLIAGRLPGRTDNEIKNYWNTHIKRKLMSRGLDPQTHRPFNDTYQPPSPRNDATLRHQSNEIKLTTDSFEDAKCSSGTTEETQPDQHPQKGHQHPQKGQLLNLDLAIGPPSQTETRPAWSGNSAESKLERRVAYEFLPVAPSAAAAQAVCLCCQIGLQKCSSCSSSSSTGLYRYC